MFVVYFINHQYYAQEVFRSEDDATEYGKSKGFDFRVDQVDGNWKLIQMIHAWSVISGLKRL